MWNTFFYTKEGFCETVKKKYLWICEFYYFPVDKCELIYTLSKRKFHCIVQIIIVSIGVGMVF